MLLYEFVDRVGEIDRKALEHKGILQGSLLGGLRHPIFSSCHFSVLDEGSGTLVMLGIIHIVRA